MNFILYQTIILFPSARAHFAIFREVQSERVGEWVDCVCRPQSAAGDEACGERDLERDAAKKLVNHQISSRSVCARVRVAVRSLYYLQSQLHKVRVQFVVCVLFRSVL